MHDARLRRGILIVFAVLLSAQAFAQSGNFAGMWETRKPASTSRAAITVSIIKRDSGFAGTVYLADRDGGSSRLTFEKALQVADTLKFETPWNGEIFYWELTLGKRPKSGTLKGAYHEMLIDEPVQKP